MCLYPRLIKNRKYTMNKKNGGIIPPVTDERTLLVPVGCGNCIECRKQKARGWQIRLQEEIKGKINGKFVTLTFSDKSILELSEEFKGLSGYILDNQIATLGTRRFLERWRKKYKTSVRHWLVTELGHNGTENIHLHGIIWTNHTMEEIENIWKYGFIWKGKLDTRTEKRENYVNAKTVNYIIKYVSKMDAKHPNYKSIILSSNKPGIGHGYINTLNAKNNKYNGKETKETYKTSTGHKISLPIYWRNKIYTEEEREKLWLQRLDKETMWVMGEKVDISKGYDTYDKLQIYYRKANIQFGYGTEEKNEAYYEKRNYENNRRRIMQQTRIKRAWAKENKKNTVNSTS